MKLHTGDTVVIIAGKDKGKTGTILRVLETDNRVVVGGLNMRTRHIKKTHQEAGRIVKFEASLHASNVMLIDPKTKKRARIGYKMEKGKKLRISKKSKEVVVPVRAEKSSKKKVEGVEEGKSSSPFWRRKGGAEAGEAKEGSHMQQDKSVPDAAQQSIHRSGGRGS